jgi:DNA modification methylase
MKPKPKALRRRSTPTPRTNPLNRDALRIEHLPIRDLRPNPNNSRLHPQKQIEKLCRAIDEFGFLIPVVIDDRDTLIAGHARVEAAGMCGLKTVPCVRTSHLSDAQGRAFAIFDNRLALDAAWDFQVLAKEFEFLHDEGFDLQTTGFEIPEFDKILASDHPAGEDSEHDQIPELEPTRAITKPDDLWILGEHCLLCADARRRDSFTSLLGGSRVHLVFADPPFNLKIKGPVSGKGRVKHGEFAEASGEKTSPQFTKFLEDSFSLLAEHSVDGSIHFICTDWRHLDEMLAAGRRVYRELKNIVVWNKTNAGLGSFYRSQHELIFVWKKGRAKSINNVQLGKHGRNRSNVWTYAGANSFSSSRQSDLAMHPTVKPVALVADAILDCSQRGDIVLDSFGGSGTTLIACERTGRKARLIEIDPVYCDQTILRWQNLTGGTAVNAAGIPFNDLDKS